MKSVLVAGGGTGGHLFPGMAVAETLREQYPDAAIHFVGTGAGIEATAVPRAGFPLTELTVVPLRGGGIRQLLRGLMSLPKAVKQAFDLVRRLQPSVVVGVGGYASGPAVLAAWCLRVPTVILEQNAAPGFTTRLLAPLVRRICLALPTPRLAGPRATVLGNPVRTGIQGARGAPYQAPEGSVRVLVFGGSLGAEALNEVICGAAARLRRGRGVVVTHQAGRRGFEKAQARAAAHPEVRVVPFIHDMGEALRDAHVVVCRAGAGSIAELGVVGRPAVLVPYPHAADDHQTANAHAWADAGAAVVLPQSTLTVDTLADTLRTLIETPGALADMAVAARDAGRPGAAAAVVAVLAEEAQDVPR